MNHPPKSRARRLIAKTHLLLALVFGLPLLITAATGTILSFEYELERFLNPGLYKVQPVSSPLPLQQLSEKVRKQFPQESIRLIRLPQAPDETVRFQTRGKIPTVIFVHPGSGAILGSRSMDQSVTAVSRAIHVSFLAGKPGSRFSGLTSLILVVLLASGLFLWWSSAVRKRKSFWKLRSERGWFVVNYDIHNLLGILIALPLAIMAVTGAVFSFPELFRPLIYQLTFTRPPAARPAAVRVPKNPVPYNLDRLLALSAQAAPGTRATIVALPKKASHPLRINRRAPGQPHRNGRHYTFINPWTEKILEHRDPTKAALGTRLIYVNRVLHTGELGGMGLRILFFATCFALIPLFLSGFCHWWIPRRSRNRRRTKAVVVKQTLAQKPNPSA